LNRYIVGPKEKQATFTGKEQRRGVHIIPLAIPGVFKLFWQPPAPNSTCDGAGSPYESQPAAEQGAAEEAPADADGYEADEDEAAAHVKSNFQFDWAAYHRAFGSKPFDEAVTAMFVEYAALCQRMAGYAGASFPQPMSLREAHAIQKQATAFISSFVTPLLGPINSTKVHRLLCHVFEAIRDHGSLLNMNTAVNECNHKEDKAHYVPTNRDPKGYTRQLVRHAQGTRLVKARLDRDAVAARVARRAARATAALGEVDRTSTPSDDDAADTTTPSDGSGSRNSSADRSSDESGYYSSSTASSTDSDDCSTDPDAECSGDVGAVAAGGQLVETKRAYHLNETTVGLLAERPGLGRAARLLNLPSNHVVWVRMSKNIEARFDCGTTRKHTTADPSGTMLSCSMPATRPTECE